MNSLYGKLAAVLLGLFLLTGFFLLLTTRYAFEMYRLESAQKFNRDLARHIVSEKILMQGRRPDEKALEDIFHQIMVVNPSIEIYLLDTAGRVLAYSAPPGEVKRTRVALGPVLTFLRGGANLPIEGDDPRSPRGGKIFSVAEIHHGGALQGYLYIILGGEEYSSFAEMTQGSHILRFSLYAVTIGLLFAFLTGLIVFAFLTRRLRRLTAAVEDFKRDGFTKLPDVPPERRHPDEIDRLAGAFREMGRRIIEQMNRLTVTDKLRRELVANVSHDLRTPIASVQGYLETLLLKQDTLTPLEQRHYLQIARKHSERLGKLVAELFELAKLDSNEVQLKREAFAIAELLQDVAQEFRLALEKKRIKLQIHTNGATPFVSGDIGLIERVLVNLIENALRYTPEDGRIDLNVSTQGGRVLIQICDTGSGIPEEDLPHLFDRFYRTGDSRRLNADGAGLGLAITKRILELHGSDITVESAPNAGTIFAFYLPADPAGAPE